MSATTDFGKLGKSAGLLDRARIVAQPGFNRWLVPPAALAIHLCIGMIYGMSVFWLPLTRSVGTACAADMGFVTYLSATNCDWTVASLVVGFEIGIVFLGASAAIWGGWLERVGPRRAGVVSSVCWSLGLAVAAVGIMQHQLWLLWLGMGVLGGIGLGIGYISPVSTLVKWFPDRRGMATGMAIMGFGGGAMIGAPLANLLMARFHDASGPGVWQTFLVLALVYAVFMLGGSFAYRVAPANWKPDGWTQPNTRRLSAIGHVHLSQAWRTPQFWLIWIVLLMNVSAGIGVLSVASPMLQQIFAAPPATAAGFVGLLSLFNIAGRFFWASISDRIGRKATYAVFFVLGIVLYAASPWAAHSGSKALFVAFFCIILSMYGGGFATIPAYLADIFGTQFVGAIHGRLLTAWSTAGVLGPLLVSYISQAAGANGVPKTAIYDTTLYVLAVLLVIGLIANLLIRPLAQHHFMAPSEVAALQADQGPRLNEGGSFGIGLGGFSPGVAAAWLVVLVPIAWGVWMTLSQVANLF
ncbi:OFA family MFS transporter [Acidisphaera sp. L21]|uniref:OFA family MFS transporter n=1 Tax=Acidisphaera sp. L21 TaxID=1641851 RepID=UPI00131D9F27|nr:OFA family MFS transporter [Acidisphaera sp. L21]